MNLARHAVGLVSGLLFGIGLYISGMGNPAKVLTFLDVSGTWDPSLALVMAGALSVVIVEFSVARSVDRSLVGDPISWPSAKAVDWRLIVGSILFGIGWGLTGICPGASLIGLGLGYLPSALFVVSLIFGLKIGDGLSKKAELQESASTVSSARRKRAASTFPGRK